MWLKRTGLTEFVCDVGRSGESGRERLAGAGGEASERLRFALTTLGPDAGTVFTPLDDEATLIQAGILAAEIRLAPGDLPSRLGGDAFTLSVLEPGDPNASVFQDGTVPDADASRALGSGGDLWLAVPVTREVRWRIDFAAMQPGALVKEAAGTADLQFRGYTMIEAEF